MDPQATEALLAALHAHDYGWRTVIPTPAGTFLTRPVVLDIQTRSQPGLTPSPEPNPVELELARLVLANLATVLLESERQFTTHYTSHFTFGHEQVAGTQPSIRISRSELEQYGPLRWTFEVGHEDEFDVGFYIEFDGLALREWWVGG